MKTMYGVSKTGHPKRKIAVMRRRVEISANFIARRRVQRMPSVGYFGSFLGLKIHVIVPSPLPICTIPRFHYTLENSSLIAPTTTDIQVFQMMHKLANGSRYSKKTADYLLFTSCTNLQL